MNKISDRIQKLPASATLAMAAKARELKSKGIDIIGLSLGEPDFNTPEFIKKAAIQAVEDNYNSYTPVDGYQDLKESIQRKFLRDNNLSYNLSQIVVSTGAKQSIANVFSALLNPGDEVLLPAPYWVSYSAIANLSEADYKIIPTDISENFKVSPDKLESYITEKSKIIVFNSPNNPCGNIYSENEYRDLGKILKKYPNLFILSDEIYEHNDNYGIKSFSIASILNYMIRTITVNGVAKAFAMTGWRIGYIGAPEWIAKAYDKDFEPDYKWRQLYSSKSHYSTTRFSIEKSKYMVDEFKNKEIK